MKDKKLIAAVITAVLVVGIIVIFGAPGIFKTRDVKKAGQKDVFMTGKGALTIKLLNTQGKESMQTVRAFRSEGGRSSLFMASLKTNQSKDLLPGTYDVEISAIPPKIYKGIAIYKGRETIENAGPIGVINVKALDARNKSAYYPMNIYYPDTDIVVASLTTNRPIEIMPSTYDIAIETLPRQVKKGVKVGRDRDTVIDIGCTTGTIAVRAKDTAGGKIRCGIIVRKLENDQVVLSTTANRSIELVQGVYKIEVISGAKESKTVTIVPGKESAIEFVTAELPRVPAAK
ncbi:MAG: hypothetical protein WC779_01140 [Candidatus Omnitrophota bacterium]